MARVTVEDCLETVDNRFDLVMVAAKRAHQLNAGGSSFVDSGKDRNSVVALREIAEGFIDKSILTNQAATSFNTGGSANMEEVEAELSQTAIDTEADDLTDIEKP